jgi:hypothetical protein
LISHIPTQNVTNKAPIPQTTIAIVIVKIIVNVQVHGNTAVRIIKNPTDTKNI